MSKKHIMPMEEVLWLKPCSMKFPVKVCENYFANIFMWTPLLMCVPSVIFQICKKATISTLKQHLRQCHVANKTNKYTATRHASHQL